MTSKQIGARIEALRRASNLSQLELANRMGYKSDSTISKWEGGSNVPNGGKLAQLAKILGTTTDYILFGGQTNIVHGDNHGVNGLSGGSGNTNTYNFGSNQKQDDHNERMANLSIADVKVQRAILNRFDQQLKIQEETNKLLSTLIDIQEETLDELKLITAPIRRENLKDK